MRHELQTFLESRRALPPPATRRAIREAARVTREDVAAEVGVSRYAVLQWERGTRNPSRRHIVAYVRVLQELRVQAAANFGIEVSTGEM